MNFLRFRAVTSVAFAVALQVPAFSQTAVAEHRQLIRFQAPRPLSFHDLVGLTAADPPPPDLERRLQNLLSEPFISNEATFEGIDPKRNIDPKAGPVLRIAEWNINRLDKDAMVAALSDEREYERIIGKNQSLSQKARKQAVAEVRELDGADIVVLDEIDDGVKRSRYENVPRQLAKALHMNYVFAVEFVELNSIYLGMKKLDFLGPSAGRSAQEIFGVDPARDRGMEGTALLSRYPILSARTVALPQEYDWYHGEIGAIDELRKAEKWTAEKLFEERLRRQVRRGGRIMLVVELAVPQAPGGRLTVICPHLEDYTTPKGRREQLDFVLKQIANISGPVIVAGDFNTLGHDGTPATFQRTFRRVVLNYKFWARELFYFVQPVPGLHYILFGLNYFKNFHDPTAFNLPILLPNASEPLFGDIHSFRFADGGYFYWQGKKSASFHHKGRTLSESNQRAWKGFQTTFSWRRTYHGLIGKYKIDWILVKQQAAVQSRGTASFRPYFGRALCRLNAATSERISDHCPSTLDLSLR